LKNKTIRLSVWATLILILATCLAGCGSSTYSLYRKGSKPQHNVLGIKLNMAETKVHDSVGSQEETEFIPTVGD
jgi:hypothetical protein